MGGVGFDGPGVGGSDGAASPTDDWTGDPDNPYRERELVVATSAPVNETRAFRPLVREALDYWEANAERYAGYPIEYRLDPDAENPDVRVSFVESIEECGTETHAAGCAPVPEIGGRVARPVDVQVLGGYANASTVAVLKHELGHSLGLQHGDDPQDVMQSESMLATLPQRNATDRALPWERATLSVHVDVSGVPADEREAARRQIDGALGYFARGAEGTIPENVSFVRTDNRTAADITIRAVESLDCGTDSGSCGYLKGPDPDGDGARERYSRLEITFANLDTEATGWHVGRWLGAGFGLEDDTEYPPPLRTETTYSERRSDWWESG